MNIREKLKEVAYIFESSGIDDPVKEAETLIIETLRIGKSEFYASDIVISDESSRHIDSLAKRRAKGEPLQYIIGYVEFFGLKINVGKGVLIPRPETELLVEQTIKLLADLPIHRFTSPLMILDLCTGSGCIALALAKHFPDAVVVGTDSFKAAIEYSVRNAEENDILNVSFMKGDLFGAVKGIEFDLIVSNPPYIRREEIKTLQREVKDYEPLEALDGGPDGLNFYRRIFKEAPGHLKKGGLLILEIGYDQADDIVEIAINAGFKNTRFIKDYSGIRRIAVSTNTFHDHSE